MADQTKPETDAKKPGILSTEFWLPGAAVAGLQGVLGVADVATGVQVAAAVSIGAIACVYIGCRTWLKLRTGDATIPGELLAKTEEGGAS